MRTPTSCIGSSARSNPLRANAALTILKEFRGSRRNQRQWLAEAAREFGIPITAEGEDLPFQLGYALDGYTGWEHALFELPVYQDAAQFFGQAQMVYSPTSILAGVGPGSIEYHRGRVDSWRLPKEQRFVPWRELARFSLHAKRPIERYSFPLVAEGGRDIQRFGGQVAIGAHGEQIGISSHWDMWNYAPAMGPMGALEVGAQGGAHMLGIEQDVGSLTSGRLADFIVLNSNPLDDIRNTIDIAFVMKGGVLYDGNTLNKIWPKREVFGPLPWQQPDVFRSDVPAIDGGSR